MIILPLQCDASDFIFPELGSSGDCSSPSAIEVDAAASSCNRASGDDFGAVAYAAATPAAVLLYLGSALRGLNRFRAAGQDESFVQFEQSIITGKHQLLKGDLFEKRNKLYEAEQSYSLAVISFDEAASGLKLVSENLHVETPQLSLVYSTEAETARHLFWGAAGKQINALLKQGFKSRAMILRGELALRDGDLDNLRRVAFADSLREEAHFLLSSNSSDQAAYAFDLAGNLYAIAGKYEKAVHAFKFEVDLLEETGTELFESKAFNQSEKTQRVTLEYFEREITAAARAINILDGKSDGPSFRYFYGRFAYARSAQREIMVVMGDVAGAEDASNLDGEGYIRFMKWRQSSDKKGWMGEICQRCAETLAMSENFLEASHEYGRSAAEYAQAGDRAAQAEMQIEQARVLVKYGNLLTSQRHTISASDAYHDASVVFARAADSLTVFMRENGFENKFFDDVFAIQEGILDSLKRQGETLRLVDRQSAANLAMNSFYVMRKTMGIINAHPEWLSVLDGKDSPDLAIGDARKYEAAGDHLMENALTVSAVFGDEEAMIKGFVDAYGKFSLAAKAYGAAHDHAGAVRARSRAGEAASQIFFPIISLPYRTVLVEARLRVKESPFSVQRRSRSEFMDGRVMNSRSELEFLARQATISEAAYEKFVQMVAAEAQVSVSEVESALVERGFLLSTLLENLGLGGLDVPTKQRLSVEATRRTSQPGRKLDVRVIRRGKKGRM